ncbi:hypothetical protein KDJ56_17470 [Brevibacillus composti]|uniref:Uncharacterized protein n=1 Tax=Brevibacillus composti TaxID=2796470 RepID=A0A7T5JN37_9BACL|nr:hypothetical protein [Brevibacillus composti]QQE73667.1 hypothetical protein JD108_17530 [Brevibacillus composti]QUO40750.1 hypothetical protein KDJ56_17470 [Brevibacillus composti]
MKKTLFALSVLSVLFFGVTTPNTSVFANSQISSLLSDKAETIKGDAVVINVDKLKNNDIKDILNYLENKGSHVVLKGLSLKEKDKMISKLYKRGDGKFRIDLDSFMAINEKHGERDDRLSPHIYQWQILGER